MGAPYAERLLPLPGFLTGGDAAPGGEQIAEGFRLTGYFLTRDILTGKLADICETRERLIERLARAGWLGRPVAASDVWPDIARSEEHTSELQHLMASPYDVYCMKKKKHKTRPRTYTHSSIYNALRQPD